MAEDEVRSKSSKPTSFLLNLFQPISEHVIPPSSTEKVLAEHYGELKEKPFFPGLLEYIKVKLLFVFDKKNYTNYPLGHQYHHCIRQSGPVVAMAWKGKGVVATARQNISI